jgi:pilus assembly protein CpaB
MGQLSLALRSLQKPEKEAVTGPFTSEVEVSRFLSRDAGSVSPILTARGRLNAGALMTDADVEWQTPPPEFPLEGLIVKGRFNVATLRGALLTVNLEPGQPLRERDIVPPSSQGFLTAALAPGMRAISVAVSNVSGVSGFIAPGSRVDVILTHEIDDRGENPPLTPRRFSETVLRDVRVLAIEQAVDETTGKPVIGGTATLEVTPKQAESIFVAVSMGELSLTLKGSRADPRPPAGRPFTSDLEISRSAWEFIRGLNRFGPGQPPKPESNEGATSEEVAEKPETLLVPPPPAPQPSPGPVVRAPARGGKRSVVKVYRNVGVSTVPVNR